MQRTTQCSMTDRHSSGHTAAGSRSAKDSAEQSQSSSTADTAASAVYGCTYCWGEAEELRPQHLHAACDVRGQHL